MDPPAHALATASGVRHDPALVPFLRADDAADADRLLGDLLASLAPAVREVVRRTLRAPHGSVLAQDADDVSGEAVAHLLRALRALRADDGHEAIQDIDAYAARVATHACHEYFRRRYPERARLRNRVWYVLSRDPGFTLERAAHGAWIGGFAGDRGPGPALRSNAGGRSLRHVIGTVLTRLGRGVDVDDLVDLVARELGVRDAPARSAPEPDIASIADAAAQPPLQALEQVEYLERLWAEVQQLPLRQRTALLLNLRDATGGDALDLLPLTGLASIREIARTLEMEADTLARLWPELPLDDRRIAERLGASRQQVINLRKAARARLGRRMAAFTAPGARPAGNTAAVSASEPDRRAPLDT